MGVFYWIAQQVDQFFGDWRNFAYLLAALVVVTPFTVLIHELGHAIAVRRFIGGDLEIEIGDGDRGVRVDVPFLRLKLQYRLCLDVGGWIVVDWSKTTIAGAIAIAAAGPLASLIALLPAGLLLKETAPGTAAYFLCLAASVDCLAGALNLIPVKWTDKESGRLRRTDGSVIALFASIARTGVPLSTPVQALYPRESSQGGAHTAAPRMETSIPPPIH